MDISVEAFAADWLFENSNLHPISQRRAFVPSLEDPSAPPSRPPPPPPGSKQSISLPNIHTREDPDVTSEKLWAAKLFKPLEDYIKTSFSSWECINSSFIDSSTTSTSNNTTQNEEAIQHPRDSDEVFIPVTENPGEKEAMMLTVGRAIKRERANSRNGRASRTLESRPVIRHPPFINWDLCEQFYNLILHAGKDAQAQLEHLEPRFAQRHHQIKYAIDEARIDMFKVLLKATEGILKRPGRPLKRPEDIWFLLVILANPLLYPGGPRMSSRRPPIVSPSSQRSPSTSKGTKGSPPAKEIPLSGPGYHSGILKRLFGLLSNLPNECHHFLITWLTIMPERHFRPLVELGGSFATYRISRHDIGKPVRNGGGMRGKVPYSDDWQIKATARVMSLLDKANKILLAGGATCGRFPPMKTPTPLSHGGTKRSGVVR